MRRARAGALLLAALAWRGASGEEVVELRPERIPPDGVFRWFADWRPSSSPRWALALGGGGSWGIAHIGVLEALEDDGLRPDAIAGTSIGAMVGAFAAVGASPYEIERSFIENDWNTVLTRQARPRGASSPDDPLASQAALLRFGRRRGGSPLLYRGLVSDAPLNIELVRHLSWASVAAGGDFDRLPIRFRAVTTDLVSGERFAPASGTLPVIVRASIGLPLFRPVSYEGRLLVDGGALENVPVRAAREAGVDRVVAVQLTIDGRDLAAAPAISSVTAQIARSYDISGAEQRRALLASADAKINIAVGEISFVDFHSNVATTVEIGREAWQAHREEVLAALERDAPRFAVRAIEAGEGVESIMAAEMAVRLGIDGSARAVSALRLELELIRILRRGGYEDGRLRVHPDGRVEVVLGRGAVVRELRLDVPPALVPEFEGIRLDRLPSPVLPRTVMAAVDAALIRARERGLFLCSLREVQWEAETGVLRVVVDEGRLVRLDAVSAASGELVESEPPDGLEGAATLRRLEDLFVELDHRREAESVRTLSVAREGEGYGVTLHVEEPPAWEATLQPGLSDALGPTVFARFSLPSLAGWAHWDMDARVAAWRLGQQLAIEVTPPSRWLVARGVVARTRLPDYGPSGELRGSRGFGLQAGAFGVRTRQGRWGTPEALLAVRTVEDDAFLQPAGVGTGRDPSEDPDEPSIDYAVDLAWSGDRRDDPARPTAGIAWELFTTLPFAGERRAAVATANLALHLPFGSARRVWAALQLHGAEAQDDRPLPLDRWSDVGSWSDAPGMLPARGLSPDIRRGTVALRVRVAEFAGTSFVAGASAASWEMGEVRADETLDRRGHGVAIFTEVSYGRYGPFVLGFARGSEDSNTVYLLARPFTVPWPGPRIRLPGR
ncbi:MAG TPA: patatin-like phospholipase family protein [Candidatus Polarisedimenticolaceae bacterium]